MIGELESDAAARRAKNRIAFVASKNIFRLELDPKERQRRLEIVDRSGLHADFGAS